MFLSGLIFGGTVVYVICQEDRLFHQNLKLEIIIGKFLTLSILLVLICCKSDIISEPFISEFGIFNHLGLLLDNHLSAYNALFVFDYYILSHLLAHSSN